MHNAGQDKDTFMKILITGNMGDVGPVVADDLRHCYPNATLIGFDAGYFATCTTTLHVLPECTLDARSFGDVRCFPVHPRTW